MVTRVIDGIKMQRRRAECGAGQQRIELRMGSASAPHLRSERVRIEPEPALDAGERSQLRWQRRGEEVIMDLELRGQGNEQAHFRRQR